MKGDDADMRRDGGSPWWGLMGRDSGGAKGGLLGAPGGTLRGGDMRGARREPLEGLWAGGAQERASSWVWG